MCKKIIQLGCLATLSLLLVACENNLIYEHPGHAANHDAQCLSLRHEINTIDRRHHRDWTKHRVEANRSMLWNQYHKLGCP